MSVNDGGDGASRRPGSAAGLRRYLGWPTLPGRRRRRTGRWRWTGWRSFGPPPPPPPPKWPSSATAAHSYLQREASHRVLGQVSRQLPGAVVKAARRLATAIALTTRELVDGSYIQYIAPYIPLHGNTNDTRSHAQGGGTPRCQEVAKTAQGWRQLCSEGPSTKTHTHTQARTMCRNQNKCTSTAPVQ